MRLFEDQRKGQTAGVQLIVWSSPGLLTSVCVNVSGSVLWCLLRPQSEVVTVIMVVTEELWSSVRGEELQV